MPALRLYALLSALAQFEYELCAVLEYRMVHGSCVDSFRVHLAATDRAERRFQTFCYSQDFHALGNDRAFDFEIFICRSSSFKMSLVIEKYLLLNIVFNG